MGDFMSDIENNNIKKIFGAEKLNGLKSDDLVNIKSKEDIPGFMAKMQEE